jgi:hypothetical protein
MHDVPLSRFGDQTGVLQSELRLTGNTILPRVRSDCKDLQVDLPARSGILTRNLPGAIASGGIPKIFSERDETLEKSANRIGFSFIRVIRAIGG